MNKFAMKLLTALAAITTLGISMNAFGFLGFGNSASWKEEVLLYDGKTIVAERKQTYGNKPTIESRERAVLDEEWAFPTPDGKGKVVWRNNFRNPPEGDSLMLLLIGFVDGVPYIATRPAGCIAYNHWGRPNPPYVFFRHNGKQWQRITLAEFPTQLKEANVIVGRPDPEHRKGTVSLAAVRENNKGLESYMRTLVREPIKVAQTTECEELIFYKGGWISPNDSIARNVLDRKAASENK